MDSKRKKEALDGGRAGERSVDVVEPARRPEGCSSPGKSVVKTEKKQVQVKAEPGDGSELLASIGGPFKFVKMPDAPVKVPTGPQGTAGQGSSSCSQPSTSINITISNGEIRAAPQPSGVLTIPGGRAIAPKPGPKALVKQEPGSAPSGGNNGTPACVEPTAQPSASAAAKLLIASPNPGAGGLASQMLTTVTSSNASQGTTMKIANKTIPMQMAFVPTSDGTQVIALPLSVLKASSGKGQVITIPLQGSSSLTTIAGVSGVASMTVAKGKQTLISGNISGLKAGLCGTVHPLGHKIAGATVTATGVVLASTLMTTVASAAPTVVTSTLNAAMGLPLLPQIVAGSDKPAKVSVVESTSVTSVSPPPPPPLLTLGSALKTETMSSTSGAITLLPPALTPVAISSESTVDSSLVSNSANLLPASASSAPQPGHLISTSITGTAAAAAEAVNSISTSSGTPSTQTAATNSNTAPSSDVTNSNDNNNMSEELATGESRASSPATDTAATDGEATGTQSQASDTVVCDFDPVSIMEWKDGVGTLPGSNLKFKVNEFGTLEMVDDDEVDEVRRLNRIKAEEEDEKKDTSASSSRQVSVSGSPPRSGPAPTGSAVAPTGQGFDPNECRVCVNCGVQGIRKNFIRQGRFCSQDCATIQSTHLRIFTKKSSSSSVSVLKESSKRKLQKTKVDTMKMRKLAIEKMERESGSNDSPPARSDTPTSVEADAGSNAGSNEEVEDVETLTGDDGNTFSWKEYLEQTKACAAPSRCFKECQLFQPTKNGFKVGMRLEGIDPQHPSLFCVLSVVQTHGFRIRLHFDGYKDTFDFWVNADNPLIFPVGWCEKSGRRLNPPKGMSASDFNWHSYLAQTKSTAAPKYLFMCTNVRQPCYGFKVGLKLEAVDKANSSLVCVASISDIIDNWLLIHFDGWDDSYDYWADTTSPYIHAINWCRTKGRSLTPPKEYPKSSGFLWEEYLAENKQVAVPSRAFQTRASNHFKPGMKLEVVDKRCPTVVRVATVAHRSSHSIKIHFDGWPEKYDYWVDDDNPDLHPVNWSQKTGHTIQPPPVGDEIKPIGEGIAKVCPTPACQGFGNIRGPKYESHQSLEHCPYTDDNLDTELPDRLGKITPEQSELIELFSEEVALPSMTPNSNPASPNSEANSVGSNKARTLLKVSSGNLFKSRKRKMSLQLNGHSAAEERPVSPSTASDSVKMSRPSTPSSATNSHSALHQSIFALRVNQQQTQDAPIGWTQHNRNLMPAIDRVKSLDILRWGPERVADFVNTIPGCQEIGQVFQEELIDGEAFLLLNQQDMVKVLGIKLGPAVKVYNSILVMRDMMDEA